MKSALPQPILDVFSVSLHGEVLLTTLWSRSESFGVTTTDYSLRQTCKHVPFFEGVAADRQAPEVGISNHGRRRHGRLVRYQALVVADVRSSLAAVVVAWSYQ